MADLVILDIEGTVGPIQFVHEVLFPYSTERMLDYLRTNPLPSEILNEILAENKKDFARQDFAKIENPSDPKEINAYLQHLIRTDRKFGPLKWIQGKIWKEGFELGDLVSELFSDVPEFLETCSKKEIPVCIYSSGSVEAQELFFKYSRFGDLTRYLSGYFDTSIGPKREAGSYQAIQNQFPDKNQVYFFTDIKEEADAALVSGINPIIMNRPGNSPQPAHGYKVLNSLLSFF
jgi:enolase-phosphatase E1